MPSYNLVNTSQYELLLTDLWQVLQAVVDDDSTQIINNFEDITYRDRVEYAKKFTDGVFLVNESDSEMEEDSQLTYNIELDCYLIFQHLGSDFTSDFHKIIALIETELEKTTETRSSIPLKYKFEITNIVRNGDLPEKFMPTDSGNPYYVAQMTVRATKLGY